MGRRTILFVFYTLLMGGFFVVAQEGVSPAPAAQPTSNPAATEVVPMATPASAVEAPAPVLTPNGKADFVGATACLACHTDREDFHSSSHARGFAQIKNIPFEKSCETCHGPGSFHAEAAGDKDNPGFGSIKNFKEGKANGVNSMCLSCHEDNKRLHWVGGTHDSKGLLCTSCHSTHQSKSKKNQLTKTTELETCAQCHKNITAQLKRDSHMPVMEGKMSCSSCHNPHGSSSEKNLKTANVNALCFQCHAEKRGPYVWQHPPVMENCLNCHAPHGSHNDKMLNAKMPFLCQRCHVATRHPSTPYDAKDISNKSNKVFAQSCLNCHTNVHGSNHPSGRMFTR